MSRYHRPLLVGAALAFVALVSWIAMPPPLTPLLDDASPARPAADPALAPDFTVSTLDGEMLRLSDLRGRVVVLNFWATWCPPCLYEIPDFIAMQEDFGMEDVVFVGLSLDTRPTAEVAQFAAHMGINYPVAMDEGAASRPYGPIRTLPTTFVIDRAGTIRAEIPGLVTRAQLAPALEELVAQAPPRR